MDDLNVYGEPLSPCCFDPKTGFFRTGYCQTNSQDHGLHLTCAIVSEEFLTFSKKMGNDLSTPRPEYDFPGLKPGDKWCLCLGRWIEALNAGVAPPLDLHATHENALEHTTMEILELYSIEKHN